MSFGLFTGSYAKNKSGGVLRKNAGSFTDEVNSSTGQFLRPAAGSIVDNLDDFKLYGYYWGSTDSNGGTWGSYSDAVPPAGAPSDNCGIVQANSGSGPPGSYLNRGDFSEGRCGSWGNPISEMYLESLRYLAHKTPNPQFTYSGTVQDTVLGLSQPSWNDPLSANTYCAPLNTLVINAATQSFDSDQLGGITDLNTAQSAQQWTNTIGDSQHENINGGTWLIGNSGSVNDSTCSPKVISALGSASGICPDQPRYQGSYDIAGIAYEAHTNRIRTDLTVPASDANSLKVTTSALTLSPNVPKITIPVGAKTVTIMPAGKFEDQIVTFGPGQIVDFKIITTGTNATGPFGTYLVQWDESGQGADYELDIDGIISYQVNTSTSQITVSTKVAGRGGNGCDGFGYVISGTNKDGAHFFSGIQDSNSANWSINGGTGCLDPATATTSKPGFYYQYTSPSGTVTTECSACTIDNNPVVPSMSATYNVTGVGGTLNDPLWYVAKYGGFHDLNGNGRPDQVAEWDKVINSTGLDGSDGIPDNYFPVTNPGQLQISLDRAFTQILGVSSSTSVATNSTSLNTGTRVFQARFNSADWSGQLLSYPVDLNGNISNTADWDSGQQINTQLPTSRVIISYNPASGVAHNNSGIPFEWSNVSANATLAAYLNQNASGTVDALGSSRLAYLRGDASNEGTSANTFRRRPVSKLGDIINSNPQYVGAPGSTDVAHTSDPTYGTFASTYANRTPVVYMGANDGLLHGFNAVQSTASGGGDEVLGYVPSRIYSDLPKFMSQNYVHRYYVDGTAIVQDVCMPTPPLLANPCPAASNWKSVLVGDLRAGGQGVFALDVTDPSQFTEANANKLALWEFTDSDDADLGFVYGQPQIGKMANGQWAVVFGNGYNNTYSCTVRPCPNMGGAEGPLDNHASATGHGVVYILFIQPGATGSSWVAGTNYIKLDTMVGTAGSPNGLAQPALVDANGDGVIDYIYVGDLQGNMWKFDVTSSNPSNWKTAFGGVGSPVPLFTAKDASNNAQPITSAPVVYPNPNGGEMVLFGTGLYLQASDASNVSQQTLYGIWDNGSTVSGRSLLVSQSVLANVTTSAGTFRVTSQNAVNYTTAPTNTGWYMDFPNVNASGNPVYGSGTATGERVAYNPIISTQKLVVNTATPSANLCTAGGTTWTMDLDPISGGTLTFSPFDVNGDNNFTTSDLVTVNGTQYYVSGIASTVGIAPTPTVISGATGSGKEYKILSGSTGGLASVLENNPGAPPPAGPLKRRAWREIFRQ
ncbi:MAG TPA: PilC/PilY family type IV pilus protein, partial [Burkholderiales bacterium]|nr:PilC/PilY family type IV pilus protein [Burkholderiales bacterium]